jgi:hypothetical protein
VPGDEVRPQCYSAAAGLNQNESLRVLCASRALTQRPPRISVGPCIQLLLTTEDTARRGRNAKFQIQNSRPRFQKSLPEKQQIMLLCYRATHNARYVARSLYPDRIPSFARSKTTPSRSFPRKRESTLFWTDVDPRLRSGDDSGDFHLLQWAAGPCTLAMIRQLTNPQTLFSTLSGKYRPKSGPGQLRP